MTRLILQVLGKSDIIKGRNDPEIFDDIETLEELQEESEIIAQNFKNNESILDLPLLTKVYYDDRFSSDPPLLGLILTNQSKWLKARKLPSAEEENTIATQIQYDGYLREEIVKHWCDSQNIDFYPLHYKIEPGTPNGVANWEKMAEKMQKFLSDVFDIENNSIQFYPNSKKNGNPIKIDELIIQHSSGTPALSSALYLWGIEKKIAGIEKIEFLYISSEETEYPIPHSGTHWQWRLKEPQIRELLEIQDFSGALRLLDKSHPQHDAIQEALTFLDCAVSLNLNNRDDLKKENLNARNDLKEDRDDIEDYNRIIERVSIALWSEKAFRERGQWMHWHLRVAGAFELAIWLLVEHQSNHQYRWEGNQLIDPSQQNKNDRLISKKISIGDAVSKLLTKGDNYDRVQVPKITDADWDKFKRFYLDNGWKLYKKEKIGFLDCRNKLYHKLVGDSIDRCLDKNTQTREGGVIHPGHPSQVAIKHLEYLLHLSKSSGRVQERIKYYTDKVDCLKSLL